MFVVHVFWVSVIFGQGNGGPTGPFNWIDENSDNLTDESGNQIVEGTP